MRTQNRNHCRLSGARRTVLLAVVMLVAFVWHANAQDDKPTGFRVLTIGSGARAIGLGETMAADVGDPFVIEYNPGGLVGVEQFTVSFAHNAYFLDTRGEYLTTAVPIGRWAVGARVGYVGTDDIPLRTGPSEDPLGFYGASNGIFQAAVAGPVDDRLSVGLSGAWVVERIDVESAETFSFGFGILYRAHQHVHIGAAFNNVGPPTKFIDREFKLPNILRAGGRWDLGPATARAEMVAGEKDNVKWHIGGEYTIDPRLVVRGGIKVGYDTHWMSAGIGARTPDQRFGVDYAFAPYTDDLGNTHRFGLTVRP